MGTGTREAERLAEQQNDGPFLVLFDVGGGEFMSPTLAETLEDVQAHVENAQKASDGNVTVRSIKLSKVLAVGEIIEALKEAMGEVRHLGEEYSKLKRKHEPPYAEYLSHSRPLGFRVLAAAGEKV